MPVPKPEDVRMMLVDAAFQSDAFVVAKGEKTKWMLELEAERAAATAKTRNTTGQQGAALSKTLPKPDPAPLPVVEKLAGVLKYLSGGDVLILVVARKNFIEHFDGVFLTDGTDVGAHAGALFDSAIPEDTTYQELRRLGMDKGGEAYNLDSVVKFVKNKTFTHCMPNGSLEDDFVCLVTLMQLDKDIIGGMLEWSIMGATVTIDRVLADLDELTGKVRMRIGETYSVPRGKSYHRFTPSAEAVQQAVMHIAKEKPFHAGQDALNSIPKWDGVPRFWELLEMIGGVIPTPPNVPMDEVELIAAKNQLAYTQLWKTFVGSVARTYEPGCQMDTMLVLKSKQGTRKSSLFRALAPGGLFSDTHVDFGNKDSMMYMQRVSWYECAELSGMMKREVQVIKNFVTSRSDNFRFPYSRSVTNNPRHCILVGSTNDDTPLKDQTGSRRFWVIAIDDEKMVKLRQIEKIVPQLWAEAIHIYKANTGCEDCHNAKDDEPRCPKHRWWLTKEEDTLREQVNTQYTSIDPLVDWFGGLLHDGAKNLSQGGKQGFHTAEDAFNPGHAYRIHELIAMAPGLRDKALDPYIQTRMIQAVRAHGWVSRHTKAGNVWYDPKIFRDLKLISGEGMKPTPQENKEQTPELVVVPKAASEDE